MKKFTALLLILLAFTVVAFGQKSVKIKTVDLTGITADLKEFVPAGHSFLGGAKGDLNLDKYPDVVLVLKKDNEKETSDVVDNPEERPLLILIGQPDKTYKLAARNDKTVLCVDCGGIFGDPFDGISITNGNFSVNHYGGSAWRWTRIVTFKYSPAEKKWNLFRDGSDSYHNSNPNKVETKIRTAKNFGKVPFEKFDVYKDQ